MMIVHGHRELASVGRLNNPNLILMVESGCIVKKASVSQKLACPDL
jgi:hypothetical protein